MFKTLVLAAALTLSGTALASAAWTTGSVNFRDGPGTNYAKLGTIARCVQVEITDQQYGWYRISWNGRWGWVSGRYISADAGYCGSNNSGGVYRKPSGY